MSDPDEFDPLVREMLGRWLTDARAAGIDSPLLEASQLDPWIVSSFRTYLTEDGYEYDLVSRSFVMPHTAVEEGF